MSQVKDWDAMESQGRFAFGDNWKAFLKVLNQNRVNEATKSLNEMLGVKDLHGKTFLDVGSGSGLFSLAARMLGAKVVSFDYDPQSVACTNEVKRRYCPMDSNWVVEQGSVLDFQYLTSLGKFDVVYSWGVLHHTGHMWQAMDSVHHSVAEGGVLFLALYNDQGVQSKLWWHIKRSYVGLPSNMRWLPLLLCYVRLWGPVTIRDFVRLRPLSTWRSYARSRGMSAHRDVIDWVGGFPFEVSKPKDVIDFYTRKGYLLTGLKTSGGGHGCNQYVLKKPLRGPQKT